MHQRPILNKSAIELLASERSYADGLRYFQTGALDQVTRNGNVFSAYVHGRELYYVKLRIRDGRVEKQCSCAYEKPTLCKHAVAVALAVAQGQYLEATSENQPPDGQANPEKATAAPKLAQVGLNGLTDRVKLDFLDHLLAKHPELHQQLHQFAAQPKP
ncbi:MAG: SWIM zinc finger family protein [Bernardetiaceae bacterium]|jgi:uncharacterized Zn finger protein|nr:SWIM zinc finger family protein [Bernardetiaceae bacterium]